MAFSPDGARLASASHDRTVKLWDAAAGQELRTLNGHTGQVMGVAFSPDGTRLASAALDGTIKLWDAANGAELFTLKGHSGGVSGVAFSPDGTRLASASLDGTVRISDAANGRELRILKGQMRFVRSVAFSPDGAWLASADDRGVGLWDARPLTPEVKAETEALALVEHLFTKPLAKADVLVALLGDRFLSEAARRMALELAERFREESDPKRYHAAAWPVIRHHYANVFMCQFALAQTKTACDLAPDNAQYRVALGVAQYRLARFQTERNREALATLSRCDQNRPATLAFLAMTQHSLGRMPEAEMTLLQLRDLLKQPEWADNDEARTFLREAEAVIK